MIIAVICLSILTAAMLAVSLKYFRKYTDEERETALLTERINTYENERTRLECELEKAHRELTEERELRNERTEKDRENFELIARRVIAEQSRELTEIQTGHLSTVLTPLKSDLENFKKKVEECYNSEARERFSLDARIKELIETSNSVGRQASELSTALRGNSKMQGDWGEMVLETILEKSGLRKGEEYEVQVTRDESGATLKNENGKMLRPDVIIRYPGQGYVVIDSKVSLTAFTELVNADDESTRAACATRHVSSIMKHVQELAEKNYQDYVGGENRLDFVMMFIPNEGAYSAALQEDPALWQRAYDKRVLLVSPTQLIGALRMVSQMWCHDRQTKNAIAISDEASGMIDKFVGFLTDLENIGKSVESAQKAYEEALKKLSTGRGNLLSKVEKLRQLGVKAKKQLPKSFSNALEE